MLVVTAATDAPTAADDVPTAAAVTATYCLLTCITDVCLSAFFNDTNLASKCPNARVQNSFKKEKNSSCRFFYTTLSCYGGGGILASAIAC